MSEFLHMGGYGRYLWPAFGLGLVTIILNLVMAWSSLRAAEREARRRMEIKQ